MKTKCAIRNYLLSISRNTTTNSDNKTLLSMLGQILQPAAVPSLCCDSSHTATIP